MPFTTTTLRILIASPSDVPQERAAIAQVIEAWNHTNAESFGITLMPVMWETHSTPTMGAGPQAIINRQLVDKCDWLIGTFWTRLGTPTPDAASGSVEEVERFIKAGKPVMLYFSSVPVVLDSVDTLQYENLKQFRANCEKTGLIDRYNNIAELREKLMRHLTGVVESHFKAHRISTDPGFVAAPDSAETAREARSNDLSQIRDQMGLTLRRYELEWFAERDSEPNNLDHGKLLLSNLATEMLDFRLLIDGRVDQRALQTLDEFLRAVRISQRHEVYVDGGESYREFWNDGSALLLGLRETISMLAPESEATAKNELRAASVSEPSPFFSCEVKTQKLPNGFFLLVTAVNHGGSLAYGSTLKIGSFGLRELPKILGAGQATSIQFRYDNTSFFRSPATDRVVELIYEDAVGAVYRQQGALEISKLEDGDSYAYLLKAVGRPELRVSRREISDRAFGVQPIFHLALHPGLGGPDGHYLTGFIRNVGRGIARDCTMILPGLGSIDVDRLLKPQETQELKIRYDDKPVFNEILRDATVVIQFEDEFGNLYEQRGLVQQPRVPSGAFLSYVIDALGPVTPIAARLEL